MLRRQTLIAIAIALILGLVAVYLANTYLLAADKNAQLSGTTRIAVAAVPLDYGSEITPEKIRFAEYPNSSIPAGSFDDIAALLPEGKKRVALMPIQPNEPILPAKISGAGEGASIAALLPAGMRATSIRINDVSGVAGFIQPNDSVDVLITRSVAGRDDQMTDVLMQSVRVLAIGQDSKNADGKPQLAKTATVLVDQVGAQKLALGQQVGSLSLVLRKPGEEDNPVVETVSLGDLRYNMYGGARYPAPATVGAYQQPAPAPQPRRIARAAPVRKPAPAAPTGTNVQVYRGVESNSYTVGGR
jgi:pilus assembly protein CpaB